jgi:hypothetical protein
MWYYNAGCRHTSRPSGVCFARPPVSCFTAPPLLHVVPPLPRVFFIGVLLLPDVLSIPSLLPFPRGTPCTSRLVHPIPPPAQTSYHLAPFQSFARDTPFTTRLLHPSPPPTQTCYHHPPLFFSSLLFFLPTPPRWSRPPPRCC